MMKHLSKLMILIGALMLVTMAGCRKDKEYTPNISYGETEETTQWTGETETQTPTQPAATERDETVTASNSQTATGKQPAVETQPKPTESTQSPVVNWTDTDDAGNGETNVTQPQQPETVVTQPAETIPPAESTQPAEDSLLTWEQYDALSNEDKQTYYKTFATAEEFYRWKDKAQQECAQQNKDNVVTGNGSLNLGDYMGS